MVRARWVGIVGSTLVSAGIAWAQSPTDSGGPDVRVGSTVTVHVPLRGDQACKVTRAWREQGGVVAYEVQLPDGEKMTVVEQAPDAKADQTRPLAGVPAAAAGAPSVPAEQPNATPASEPQPERRPLLFRGIRRLFSRTADGGTDNAFVTPGVATEPRAPRPLPPLPQANATADPLMNLAQYDPTPWDRDARKLAATAAVGAEPTPARRPSTLVGLLRRRESDGVAPAATAAVQEAPPISASGMQSVLMAGAAPASSAAAAGVPADEGNAFSPGIKPTPKEAAPHDLNAFAGPPEPPAPDAPPVVPPPSPANLAFQVGPNPAPAVPAAAKLPDIVPMPAAPLPDAQQLLSTLRQSPYPSERAWAVETLTAGSVPSTPSVVAALLTAAREDPATDVRVTCIRGLRNLGARSEDVLAALQALKCDSNAHVRDEAGVTLTALASPTGRNDRGVITPVRGN
jgi:hypothetical protein